MFNLFKKKSDMRVFNLGLYLGTDEELIAKRKIPKRLSEVYLWRLGDHSISINSDILATNYLRLKPNRFENINLETSRKATLKLDVDIEQTTCNYWVSSEKFKEFSERENLGFEFFPVLVENKRRYLMSWRGLPTFYDYDVDTEKTEYSKTNYIKNEDQMYFRSDVIEYYGWKAFCNVWHSYIYITGEIKEKMEQENFLFTFDERRCTQKVFNKKTLEKHLIEGRKKERQGKVPLSEGRKKKLQATDEALEQILIEDGETEILEKFRKEMKGIWKKDFDRYEKGEMGPLEKITFW